MSFVDLALIALALLFALSGFRQGLIVSAASFVGFFGGAVAGAQLSGPVADQVSGSSLARVFVALVVVLAGALLGQLVFGAVGRAIRRKVTWEPAKVVDSVAGAFISAVAVLLVAWMVATPLANSAFPAVASQVRQSTLVQAVDQGVPDGVRSLYDSLREAIDRRGLPDVLDPLTPTQVRDVPAPDQGLLASPVVTQVRGSVVQISGIASSCSRQIDGSGFVYADERVMTNAHVLAGVTSPTVNAEGESYDAVPVFVDEETDVAVLAVPGLPQVPLTFAAQPADSGADAIIMGYPGGGGLYVGPARVRDRGDISGPDFRASQTVVRDVYALFGQVRAGNSGGPLLATDGTVLGVVFASAIDDPDTGYALTGAQVAEAAAAGSTARTPVDTGPCE
ncbi:colicin V production protein [Geodermatophilus sp. Leaf369]|uniref:MarP family serine protease n=1 Tax=Geodermatophilus sp. Leaf369 TaxID=1736354 RepID=UPI0006F9592B|nr:MarP family serine protease [Geodermatophilus sp. Leaf369]KQS60576.1 colicin V production protein [Geodermatophilus sp. Leaf369]QNG37336.1 MarP family serine protease [Geodermatophilaceae bacterium NBWT11]